MGVHPGLDGVATSPPVPEKVVGESQSREASTLEAQITAGWPGLSGRRSEAGGAAGQARGGAVVTGEEQPRS